MPADITCTDFDMERAGLSRVCAAGMATIDADLAAKAAACFASANATFSARRCSASRNFDALLSAEGARASAFYRLASKRRPPPSPFSRAPRPPQRSRLSLRADRIGIRPVAIREVDLQGELALLRPLR